MDSASGYQRVERQVPGKLTLIPDNREYQPWDVDFPDPYGKVSVVGEVVWMAREM